MTVQLIGIATANPASFSAGYNNLLFCFRYIADYSGSVTGINVKSNGNSACKVALYADNSGEPGARLAKQDTPASISEGWNTVSLEAAYSITQGTYYWIAFAGNDSFYYQATASGAARRYKAITYSTFSFPDPAGSGYTSDTSNPLGLQGWGDLAVVYIPNRPFYPHILAQ